MSEPSQPNRGPFVYSSTVRFADVDHAGIVYYPVYYHYFHVAFEEFFRERMGAQSYIDLLDVEKIGFPAVHSECNYRSPLVFNDTIETKITLNKLGSSSLTLNYSVRKISSEDGKKLAAEGHVVCVFTDLVHFKPIKVPEKLRRLFLELQ